MTILHSPLSSRRALRNLLLIAAMGLTLGVSACAPSSETATAGGTSEPTTTAQTASDSESDHTVYVKDGVAIGGADPVAYFTDEAFVAGSAEFTHEWKGVTWQFSSAENRDLFASNPEQYAPQYGGYCAWAVGQNALAAIDPNAWSVVDDKLYLNASPKIQERWSKDIPGNIAMADANWPTLSTQ